VNAYLTGVVGKGKLGGQTLVCWWNCHSHVSLLLVKSVAFDCESEIQRGLVDVVVLRSGTEVSSEVSSYNLLIHCSGIGFDGAKSDFLVLVKHEACSDHRIHGYRLLSLLDCVEILGQLQRKSLEISFAYFRALSVVEFLYVLTQIDRLSICNIYLTKFSLSRGIKGLKQPE
jgi:hypothetical protein